jgi:hypothetical protein
MSLVITNEVLHTNVRSSKHNYTDNKAEESLNIYFSVGYCLWIIYQGRMQIKMSNNLKHKIYICVLPNDHFPVILTLCVHTDEDISQDQN